LTLVMLASCATPMVYSEARDEGIVAELDVADWRTWPRANPKRFQSKGHGYLWVDVHVAPDAAATYADRNAVPAPGFRVLMAGYDTATATKPTGLTLMAKVSATDWFYAVLGQDGKKATLQGAALPVCTGCHQHAPRTPIFGLAP
jgi:hypothetical protein